MSKKNMNEISLKELFDTGSLDNVVFATAGGYLGEPLEQIVAQKYADLRSGELFYEPDFSTQNYAEEKRPVCLWALQNYTADWLQKTLVKKTDGRIYVLWGMTGSDSKSSCENKSQNEQAYAKKFIIPPEQEIMEYPKAYHKEYISQSRNSMAFVLTDLFVAKENFCFEDLKEYYNGYYENGTILSCSAIPKRRPCVYAEVADKDGLNCFLSEKQNTIDDDESGVLIGELVYPFVVKLVS